MRRDMRVSGRGSTAAARACALLVAWGLLPTLLALGTSVVRPQPASASLPPAGTTTSYTDGSISNPRAVTTGPDGALWFVEADTVTNHVGRVTTAGQVTRYVTTLQGMHGITAGPDGALWIAAAGAIGRVATTGEVTSFAVPFPYTWGIVTGADGALWFTTGGGFGRITTDGVVSTFSSPTVSASGGITNGPDGALWFVDDQHDLVGRMTTAGAITTYSDPAINSPSGITTGPDGALWFTNLGTQTRPDGSIGRITTTGAFTFFSDPLIYRPFGITTGPDGALWFAHLVDGGIGRITTDGLVSSFSPTPSAVHWSITEGPDGGLWYTNSYTNSVDSIGRIAAVGPPSAPVDVTATPGRTSATVSWGLPGADGAAPITGYTVTASPGGATCTTLATPRTCTIAGLTAAQPYTFTVTATNSNGVGAVSAPSSPAVPWSTGVAFHPMVPMRVLDSRTATGGWNGPLVSGVPRELSLASVTPVANPTAVVLNLTVTGGTTGSFLRAWPTGAAPPTSSNLNFAAGETIANLVTTKLGPGSSVTFTNAVGSAHVIADVVGFYDDGTVTGATFHAVGPTRVLDSRTAVGGWSGKLPAGQTRELAVPAAVVPVGATSVVANVTVTDSTANSYLRVWPGQAAPDTSSVNFGAGQTIANLVSVPLGAGGVLDFANAAGAVHVVVDVVGYFAAGDGGHFHPTDPTRILDDRSATGLNGPWSAGQTRTLPVAGHGDVPADASAIIANMTVTNPTAASFLTVGPTPGGAGTSSLNFGPAQTIANLSVVGTGAGGGVDIHNAAGSTDVIADLEGWFAGY